MKNNKKQYASPLACKEEPEHCQPGDSKNIQTIAKQSGTANPEIPIDNGSIKSNSISQANPINPFLVFHSPDESEKTPFRKHKHIKKLLTPDRHPMSISDFDEALNSQILFTQRQWVSKRKLGMISVTKLQWMKKQTLTYVHKYRAFIRLSKCEKCQKIFSNHEALGGHKRICQKAESSQ